MDKHAQVGVLEQIQTGILGLEDGALLAWTQVLGANHEGLLPGILHTT